MGGLISPPKRADIPVERDTPRKRYDGEGKMLLPILLLLASSQTSDKPVVVRCQFKDMPPMALTFHAGSEGSLTVGKSKPVPLHVGSSLSTATYGAQELTFSLRLPASVTVSAPGNDTKTYGGRCISAQPK